jgi:putative aminophosphonate oxidoreductase
MEGGAAVGLLNAMSATGPRELTHRSLWLQQALPEEEARPAERARGDVSADVCIMGGGYTGLWTALFLKEHEPTLDVVLLEADICGAGASGRNGGFALSWWAKLASLIKIAGEDDGVWLAREAEAAVDYLGAFAREHDIEAEYVKAGWLWTATSQAQKGTWEPTLEEAERRGIDVFERLSPEDVQRRAGSTRYLAGVLEPSAAIVHPGRLVRGLRRVALDRGVRIHEHSPVVELELSSRPVVRTPGARIRAEKVVSALNAWTPGLAAFHGLRRSFVAISSDIVATEPIPDLLEEIGWTGGESITDSRLLVHYHRTTADGRIAIGRGGGALGAAGRFGESFHYDRRRSEGIAASLRWLYPQLRDTEITHAWAGPIDRSESGIPFFGRLDRSPNVYYGLGFSGNGVGPCVLGGRILASLVLGSDDRYAHNGLTKGPKSLFPPEPVRFLGGILVREAVRRKESLDDEGREAGPLVRAIASLAPAGLFKVGEPAATADAQPVA